MIIIFKITDYFPETDQIAVKFCREKSPISIDDYNPIAINLKGLDAYDVKSFSESLVDKSGLRRIDKQEKKLTTLDDNTPEKLDGDLNVRDLSRKGIGVEYPTKIYSKIKMRRVEL